jgi:5-methylcytosine-specific restriction endonuclease McrA
MSARHHKFRNAMLERDNYKCVRCPSNNNLTIHHIKPKSDYPELKNDINNVITLCRECHDREHKE